MRLILINLVLFFAVITNAFGQEHKNPRFENPIGLMALLDDKVYLYCMFTDSIGQPICFDSYTHDFDNGRFIDTNGEFIYTYNTLYSIDEKREKSYYYHYNCITHASKDTIVFQYNTGYGNHKKDYNYTYYEGFQIDFAIPNLGTMSIVCNLKGYNPIYLKVPFEVGKFRVAYCEEDNTIKIKRIPFTLYCGKLIRDDELDIIVDKNECVRDSGK